MKKTKNTHAYERINGVTESRGRIGVFLTVDHFSLTSLLLLGLVIINLLLR